MSCGFDNVDRRLCKVFGELKLGKKQLETLPSDASGLVDSEFNTRDLAAVEHLATITCRHPYRYAARRSSCWRRSRFRSALLIGRL
jgi:hypothetical protein